MLPPPPPLPPPTKSLMPRKVVERPIDPLAVVAANATALGIGYMLLRRPRVAAVALTGTLFLLFALAGDPGNPWWRGALAVWWLTMILHSWFLARGAEAPLVDLDDPRPVERERLFGFGVAALVLLLILGLRFDAWMTVRGAAEAHTEGDCESAAASLDGLDATHRIAFGPMTLRAEEDREACELLLQAFEEAPWEGAETLISYMEHPAALWEGAGPSRGQFLLASAGLGRGDIEAHLEEAFAQLTTSLEETPDQSGRVREVVEMFLEDLAADRLSCKVMQINEWIYAQESSAPELAEPVAAAAEQVPIRLLECARMRAEADDLQRSQETYLRFLADFPDHEMAAAAADELYAVETQIEYENVTELLTEGTYCENPAPYRAAAAYEGKGPHRMWTFGLSPGGHGFPSSWQATGVDDTVLVTCVEGPSQGRFLESCYYEGGFSIYGPYTEVSFYQSRFDIKVYELQSGDLVADYIEDIGNNSCPQVLTYESYIGHDLGPPSEVESEYSDKEVREMFYGLMD